MARREDIVLLRDMLDAAKEAVSFAQGRERGDLDKDRKLVLSLVHLVEIVGEAAGKVSEKFQKAHAEVPWAIIVGMRNRLIHAYFDIDLDRVWDTAKEDLPSPVVKLEKIVHAED